jgi:predicted porin
MKKSLLALAVFGAFAGAASAQTNVTIYGLVDMSINREDNGVNTKTALDSGQFYGSRIGFKGSEDLGNGLKANFQLENGFEADTGALHNANTLFNRQAWVGLSGGFGSVNFGRQYAPIFIVADSIDPFDAGMTSGNAGASTSTGGMLGIFGTTFRTNNTVTYTTTNLNGFTGSLAYSFGEAAGSTSANRQIGLSGAYENGPIYAGVAFHNANDAAGNATKQTLIGGTYNFGVAKPAIAYQKNTSDLNTTDNKSWMLGVTVPVGAAGNFLASYIRSTDNTAATANKGTQYAVGYMYDLSKRTTLYTSYSRNTNDANSNIGGLAAAKGLTDTLFNFGIRHKF